MLVYALDLEKVEEVGAGSVDFDEVLVGRGLRCREGGDFELFWSRDVLFYLYSPHGEEDEREKGLRGKGCWVASGKEVVLCRGLGSTSDDGCLRVGGRKPSLPFEHYQHWMLNKSRELSESRTLPRSTSVGPDFLLDQ